MTDDNTSMPQPSRVMTPFWLVAWALLLSCAWLVPNHFRPWASFHADALAALAMLLGAAAVMVRSRAVLEWNRVMLLLAALACVPLVQLRAGLIAFDGQAWTTSSYLLGALLAVHAGQAWERSNAGQSGSALFIAVGIGSVASVGLQLLTWLGLHGTGVEDIWSMGLVDGRPYANIGQPNQLATLLLWGVLAAGWAYQKGKIGPTGALVMAAFLLLGVALTQSRTAWLGMTFLLICSWAWRSRWRSRWLPWCSLGLFMLFWTFPEFLRWLSATLLIDADAQMLRSQLGGDNRYLAAMLFCKAVLTQLWLGFGWTEVAVAQMAVADQLPGLGVVFGHTHNLFLDLMVWLGLPAGLMVSLALVAGFIAYLRAIRDGNDLILVMFLGVIGIHSMLELPLQYAYFLLPTAMVVGMLNVRSMVRPMRVSGRWTGAGLWLAGALLYAVIVRDYFRVESNYQRVRFEREGFTGLPVAQPPDVLLLTQWREQLRFMRYAFRPGMDESELRWAIDVANNFPSPSTIYKVATALALNDRQREATLFMRKGCKITDLPTCELMRRAWAEDGLGNPRIAAVPWPP